MSGGSPARAPLSFAQERLWFLDRLQPGDARWNICVAFRLDGAVAPEALRRAFEQIVARHAVLRTTCVAAGDAPCQSVHPATSFRLPVVDLSSAPDPESRARRHARDLGLLPFDLQRDTPLRASLVRIAPRDHLLVIVQHHIAGDGWSRDLLFAELGEAYAAAIGGRAPDLAPLTRQYADFAAWQRARQDAPDLVGHRAYWRDRLHGLAPLDLPADRPRPPALSSRAGRAEVALSRASLDRLRALAREEGATDFTALLAAAQALLGRVCGVGDVALGVPVATRPCVEFEPLIGLFLNTLVIRADLAGRPTFRGLLRQAAAAMREAIAHQDVPFEQVVAAAAPAREPGRGPLVPVLFNQAEPGDRVPALGDLIVRRDPCFEAQARTDLTFYVSPGGETPRVRTVHAADLYDDSRIARLLEQYGRLIDEVAADPDRPIGAYSLVTPATRRLLADPTLDLPAGPHAPVTVQVLRATEQFGDRPAIEGGRSTMTYAALGAAVHQAAGDLRARGLTAGDVVALDGRRGPGMVVGLLAVMTAGGVVLPIDPRLPPARKVTMLREASARWLLAGATSAAADWWTPAALDVRVVAIDEETGRLAPTPDAAPAAPGDPADVDAAYVFFTSGSTGRPKGILGRHRSLAHFVDWQRATFGIRPEDRVAQFASWSFDVMLREIFLPLTTGATLCLPDEDAALSPAALDWLRAERVTVLHVVPSVARRWLEGAGEAGTPGDLRWVFFAGEPLSDALVHRWRRHGPGGDIVNLYGPTETCLVKCWYPVPAAPPPGIQPGGFSLPGSQVLVVNGEATQCAPGEPGEVVLRTPFGTAGYLPSTDDRSGFRPNPFLDDPADLVYFTGDRGRIGDDGRLELLGRADDQVKIRGVRVEPAEVAAVLERHPAVRAAAVAAREDAAGEPRLIAWVVAAGVTVEDLRAHVAAHLPPAMVPQAFAILDALPLTPNGKVDRAALPDPGGARPVLAAAFVAPRTDAERRLGAIWREVLGLEQVGVLDDFFALGGHSLLVTRVAVRAGAEFGVDLPLRRYFERSTLEALAATFEASSRAAGHRPAPADPAAPSRVDAPATRRRESAVTAGGDGRLQTSPLSSSQRRLWFLDELAPDSAAYNLPIAVRLIGSLDARALRAALGGIVARHAVLRSTIAAVDGEPHQIIHPPAPFELPVLEVVPDGVTAAVERATVRRFDLAREYPLRGVLLRAGPEDHVLALTLHHIAGDAWSIGVLARELGVLYGAALDGTPSPLTPLDVQYGDFAAWQQAQLAGPEGERQRAFWRAALGGVEPVELPADRPRGQRPTYRSGRHNFTVSGAVLERLRAIGRAEAATPFMMLLAAFDALLARYTSRDDVAVAIPIANRSRPDFEPLIGFLVNTLVIRTDLAGQPTFRELIRRVRGVALDAFEHQEFPFEQLVADLQPTRDLGRSPLAQVLFAMQTTETTSFELRGLRVEPLPPLRQDTGFDLELHLRARDGVLRGSIVYAADLFDPDTVERFAAHFAILLDRWTEDPDRPLDELSLLAGDERQRVLVDWNATETGRPAEGRLEAAFEAQRARTPDAVALVAGDTTLTYAGLDERADRLAGHLRRLGVGPDVPVGLGTGRNAHLLAGLLGILKAGAAWLPLDPAYPAARLAFMLDDARATVVVTDRAHAPVFEGSGRTVVLVEEALADSAPGGEARPTATAGARSARDAAYVIYTSGSTGQPKGVVVPHDGVTNLLAAARDALALTPEDVVLSSASVTFDISVADFFVPLTSGARLVLVPREVAADAEALLAALEASGATVFQATPSMLRLLVGLGWHPAAGFRCISAGEALPADLARVLADRVGALWNMYGPTETTIWSTGARLAPPIASVGIGRPLANTRVYVLDPAGQPVPIGVPGELFIGGAGVTRGYLHRPALTAERFIASPFVEGDTLYRTGDAVRWTRDGTLEFLGRLDHQVKIRGYRIETGEIEAALARHPDVASCAVIARTTRAEPELVAYVVPRPGASVGRRALEAHLRIDLPEYMVPAAVVMLDALPLTPSGKIDRRALPAPGDDRGIETAFVAPRTTLERELARLWEDVLGTRVGAEDDFFELGGHSLLATRLVVRIRRALGVESPLRALFEAPTVAALARRLGAGDAAAASAVAGPAPGPAAPAATASAIAPAPEPAESSSGARASAAAPVPAEAPVPPAMATPARDRDAPVPLSFAQQRLWFLDQLEPGTSAYNIPVGFDIEGPLDEDALTRAIGEIVSRHEVLRTVFPAVRGEPRQVVRPVAEPAVTRIDLRPLAPDARTAELARLTADDAVRPFDLQADPMLRATLVRIDDDRHRCLCTFHHIAADGGSLAVFVRELGELYAAITAGRPPRLPALPAQYADFAAWQRDAFGGEVLARGRAYWRDALRDLPPLELPLDHPRPARRSYRGESHPVSLPPAVVARLRAIGRAEGATLFMVLLAVFDAVLARRSGQADFAVGSPISDRPAEVFEPLVGFFANTIVLRADLSGDPSFRTLVARVRRATLDAYDHKDVPFEQLVAELDPDRDLGRLPLVNTVFSLRDPEARPLILPGVSVAPCPPRVQRARFDLELHVTETSDGGARGQLMYATDLFDAATIEQLATHIRVLAEAAAEEPDRAVACLPILTAEERRQVLSFGTGISTDSPRQIGLAALFAAQVARAPEAPAVSAGGVTLSRAALDARARALAARLADLGVGPEGPVGLCLERGIDAIVATLAVVIAGGTYVPLDPADPSARLRLLLDDARAPVVVTQRSLRHRLPDQGRQVVCVEEVGAEPVDRPWPAVAGEQAACVMYTSGSTGQPKGVVVPHRAIVRLVVDTDYVRFGPDDVVAQASNLAFDAATFEIWGALLNGARLAVFDRHAVISTGFPEQLAREGVTILFLTTALFNHVAQVAPGALCGVGTVVMGGERASVEAVRRVIAAGPPARLINGYGPTEATTFSTWHPIEALDPDTREVPIGRPLANTSVYVLDGAGALVPIGVPGEVYVGGDGVARGYLHDPARTAERFVPDPFHAGRTAYRTGDLARWRGDGRLEFLGRNDGQVKLRGHRIEPGEIEAALLELPDVRAAAVVPDAANGSTRLVAFLAGEPGRRLAGEVLAARLRERLPAYMVPAAFVWLDALPVTASGKIDRRALRPPPPGAGGDAATRPMTDTEARLGRLWTEVLGVTRVRPGDSFFELGGHSLLAVRLFARIEETFGVRLPLSTLFPRGTLEALAGALDGSRESEPWTPLVPIRPAGGDKPLFLVHGIGGEVLSFTTLALHLPPGRPVYGIQAPGPGVQVDLPADLEGLARRYVEVISTVDPDGPYYVCGYSSGGVLALEIARQLRAEGRPVGLLVVLDGGLPRAAFTAPRVRHTPGSLARQMAHWFVDDFLATSAADWWPRLQSKARSLRHRWSRRPEVPPDIRDTLGYWRFPESYRDLLAERYAAFRQYRPQPYDGAILLLRSRTSRLWGPPSVNLDQAWRGLARGSFEVVYLPGSHGNLLAEPRVRMLARVVAGALDRAR